MNDRRLFPLLGSLCLFLFAIPCRAQSHFFFHDGDTPVLFLGDSITEQKRYTVYIEAYVLTRFPKWNITFRNVGWGGDTASLRMRGGLDAGLKRDVFNFKPHAITVDFGMNDARGGDYQGFVNDTAKLTAALQRAGIRVALLTPSPEERLEANQPAGSAYNRTLSKFSNGVQQIANKSGSAFADQFTPFVAVLEALHANSKDHLILIPDSVHPDWPGHLVMATSILKGLGAPALVSHAEIDATGKKKPICQKCTVEMQTPEAGSAEGTLVFRRTDECLPWPIPTGLDALASVPRFDPLAELNRYELKVMGLKADKYTLFIDDAKIGAFDKKALTAGVNLALQAGPITEQANKLWAAILEKDGMFWNRWRGAEISGSPQAELDKLDAAITDKEKEMAEIRQPKPHTFKLVPGES